MDNDFLPTGKNREKNTEDDVLFGSLEEQHKLRQGLEDMYFLLSRNYPAKASLALVGNRYQLIKRQITALQGMAASRQEIQNRQQKEIPPEQLKGNTIFLDGFNILILLETVLSGGFVFKGLDGCFRDISSVQGAYRKVAQTEDVLLLMGKTLQQLGLQKVVWIFDAPVSNSGKMKALCYEMAEKHGFPWEIHLENSPDKFLIEHKVPVCSSDAWVLDECSSWFNLGAWIISEMEDKRLNIVDPGPIDFHG